MPLCLKIITGCLFLWVPGSLFLLFLIFFMPQGTFHGHGMLSFLFPKTMTVSDLWSTGHVYILLMLIFIMCVSSIICAVGVIKQKKWSCFLLIVLYIACPMDSTVHIQSQYYLSRFLEIMLNFIIPLSIYSWYLFKKQNVVKYFNQ